MNTLDTREYARMLDLAVALFGKIDGSESPWRLICTELMDSLDVRLAGCFEVQWPTGATRAVAAWPTWTEQMPWTPLDVAAHPLVRHFATRRDTAPRTIGEVADEYRWCSSTAYASARAYFDDASWQFMVPLGRSNGVLRYVGAARTGTDFNNRDRVYLRRLQPLLISLDNHLRTIDRWRETQPAMVTGADHAAVFLLTPRELAILTLLADGLTAIAIARRLRISVHTVSKHQQNLYRKLDTGDRLTTVLRAQQVGILAEPGAAPPQPDRVTLEGVAVVSSKKQR